MREIGYDPAVKRIEDITLQPAYFVCLKDPVRSFVSAKLMTDVLSRAETSFRYLPGTLLGCLIQETEHIKGPCRNCDSIIFLSELY